jgi:hypothetical protein
MKTPKFTCTAILLGISLFISSCNSDDPGPIQYGERTFALTDFTQLDMGSAFKINVQQGNAFNIRTTGDVRNLDDLVVYTSGNTLLIHYDNTANRKHATSIYITMPALTGVQFSGASVSEIRGFADDSPISLTLSGASLCRFDSHYDTLRVNVSGASRMEMTGSGQKLHAVVSGASELHAYDYPVQETSVSVSGSSLGRLSVSTTLKAIVSGASAVKYRGNPAVIADISGSSSLTKE